MASPALRRAGSTLAGAAAGMAGTLKRARGERGTGAKKVKKNVA